MAARRPLCLLLLLALPLLSRAALAGGGSVGAACTTYRDCLPVQYSECKEERCSCRSTLIPTNDGMRCLQRLDLDYRCDEDVQCIKQEHAACLPDGHGNRVCRCKPHYYRYLLGCLPEARLGEPCKTSGQCLKNMVCEGGKCVCRGFAFELNRQCVLDMEDYVVPASSWRLTSSSVLIFVFPLLKLL